ncbi:hypothetical protein HYV88_05950 [Candidatus Woesearchaeota archaeon]|nr:hypothetical protein [Candidatus Woesearchaeota archaeon]
MKSTSIDKALLEMLYVAHNINRFMSDIENSSGHSLQTIYFPPELTRQWQEQLNKLKAMKKNNPRKTIYNHQGISQLATFFGLQYHLT